MTMMCVGKRAFGAPGNAQLWLAEERLKGNRGSIYHLEGALAKTASESTQHKGGGNKNPRALQQSLLHPVVD